MEDNKCKAYENLQNAINEARSYPKNLQRSKVFEYALTAYHDRLEEAKDRLFDANPRYALVELLESKERKKNDVKKTEEFVSTRCKNLADLKSCLGAGRAGSGPASRHIFFESEHSRAPLDCSIEMFTDIMSRFQVMPQFLDLVFAFGRQSAREDFHYTAFRRENYFDRAEAERFAIARMCQSGMEYRQCYSLCAVERSGAGGPPWSVRRTAMYHSFDVKNGKALWINISANSEIKSRITSAMRAWREPSLQPGCEHSDDEGVAKSLAATLATHLMAIEWSAENWRPYINSLETAARETLNLVNNVPLRDIEQDSNTLIKPLVTRNAEGAKSSSISLNQANMASTQRSRRTLSGITIVEEGQPPPWQSNQTTEVQGEKNNNMDPFTALHGLSFDSLQRLNTTQADLHRANLVMKLNQEILTEQIRFYQTLLDDEELPPSFRAHCRVHVVEFVRCVGVLARLFAMEQARVTTLLLLLSDGRDLLDKILQFRNIQISTLFSIHSHESAARMEEMTREMHRSTESMHQIAAKTERETSSMHIITLVTLVFLPGTFVATVLGSGLFRWDDNDPSQPLPVFRPKFFALFAQICFPLMGATGFVWLAANSWLRWGKGLLPWGRGGYGVEPLKEGGGGDYHTDEEGRCGKQT